MAFASWNEFVNMGGYALYVWASYALTFVVMTGLILLPWLHHRELQKTIERQARREQRSGENS